MTTTEVRVRLMVAIDKMISWRVLACLAAVGLGACSLGDLAPWQPAERPVVSPDATGLELPPPVATAGADPLDSAPLVVVEAPPVTDPPPPVAAPPPPAVAPAVQPRPPIADVPADLLRLRAAALANETSALSGLIDSQRAEFQGLSGGAAEATALYDAALGAIRARLQAGAAPDDPILLGQWRSAESALQAVAAAYSARLHELRSRIATNSGLTAYLAESARAARAVHAALGVDESEIAGVESALARAVGENDRLLADVGAAFERHAAGDGPMRPAALPPASGDPAAVAAAVPVAPAAVPVAPPPVPAAPAAVSVAPAADNAALITIRFDRADVAYENALYDALSAALARRPDARFELVAVAPAADSAQASADNAEAAGANAERVVRSMMAMNLPPDRLDLSFTTSSGVSVSEVRVFVR